MRKKLPEIGEEDDDEAPASKETTEREKPGEAGFPFLDLFAKPEPMPDDMPIEKTRTKAFTPRASRSGLFSFGLNKSMKKSEDGTTTDGGGGGVGGSGNGDDIEYGNMLSVGGVGIGMDGGVAGGGGGTHGNPNSNATDIFIKGNHLSPPNRATSNTTFVKQNNAQRRAQTLRAAHSQNYRQRTLNMQNKKNANANGNANVKGIMVNDKQYWNAIKGRAKADSEKNTQFYANNQNFVNNRSFHAMNVSPRGLNLKNAMSHR